MSTQNVSGRRPSPHLLPTLLDRLIDNHPQSKVEAPQEYAVSSSHMKEIVQRDLSWLLNTTNLIDELSQVDMPLVNSSVLNYGVPPFAGRFMTERNWHDIEKIIRQAVTDFEPRLLPETLQVVPIGDQEKETSYNVLWFEIRGLVHMQPYPMEFLVQSSLDLETNRLTFS
jgi:type VI secretion system protein ImpF